MTHMNTKKVTYSDEMLRILEEKYITMKENEFTFKDVCSLFFCRATEVPTANIGLYESDQIVLEDCARISRILE